MGRVFNFSSGPAVLPQPVLEKVQSELLDWQGSGMSVMEMSHRGEDFTAIATRAEAALRRLLDIPDDYRVLFLQGGATAQFSMVPMNLLREGGSADFIDTGIWSRKAMAEAARYGRVRLAGGGERNGYARVPTPDELDFDPAALYVHYTPNETIGGVEFSYVPDSGSVPLVADMSSTILSRPLDVRRFGLIYAGAQKNIGPAGLTLVIVREDLLGEPATAATPTVFDYRVYADNASMYNTPPTFAWYIAGEVFEWIEREGGLKAMGERNHRKAAKLYALLDASDFYRSPVAVDSRSWMNATFTLADEALSAAFLEGAESSGLKNLKGHRSVGGMRASLYNAMPEAGVDALVEYMREFERVHG
ncbi:3-phosphoserine/phosphohydroxythreonine transaminase [Acidihalobacter prosperus]|uniref:Phosphoserine aminotransferase n=1 Tax=Acidihalobacter prosperus TaxID=160660 RepID=A0A1A6C7E9_9GAMM|nr:3-phosphoserine/phosphohydroxythreonine transaminase [Acidihalobacter prosperus]OBS10474.1 3-phosphoserine/phosphohydroxythreonine aminotransferase [Acidihalobacter prosperus]